MPNKKKRAIVQRNIFGKSKKYTLAKYVEDKTLDNVREMFKDTVMFSLGYNCDAKLFIRKLFKENNPSQLFDWIGIPLWGINKMLNNDFDKFFEMDDMISYKFDKYLTLMNKEYFMRFLHERLFLKCKRFDHLFKKKYERRIDRFKELLNGDKKIVFVVLEENRPGRVESLPDELKQHYPSIGENYHKEQHELSKKQMVEFCNIIKTKYGNSNFKVLYFSDFEGDEDTDDIMFMKLEGSTDNHLRKFEPFLKSIIKRPDDVVKHINN